MKQSATRKILKELYISNYSYPLRGIFLSGSPADVPIAEHSIFKEQYLSDNSWQ